jgi:hypothetical protein
VIKRGRVENAVLFQTLFGPRPEIVQFPTGLGAAHDSHAQLPAFDHRRQRGIFFVCQVAGSAEHGNRIKI